MGAGSTSKPARSKWILLRGMCQVENGMGPLDGEWYPDLVWQAGVKMALEPLTRSRTMTGGAVAALNALRAGLAEDDQAPLSL